MNKRKPPAIPAGRLQSLPASRARHTKHAPWRCHALLAFTAMGTAFAATDPALAHGFAGKRFFPATLATDDPFVADELSLPTISTIVTPDGGGTHDTELSVEISK